MIKKINVIGDSHCSIYLEQNRISNGGVWEQSGDFSIMHLGPLTAYNVCDKPEAISTSQAISNDEYILYSFGEIDCRCRIGRSDNPKENMIKILQRYFSFIESQQKQNIILTNLTPCLVEEPMKDWFNEDISRKETFTATRGTLEERNTYKLDFSNQLKEFCKYKNYIYVDFWDMVYDKKELYMDDVHLNGEKIGKNIKTLILNQIS